MIIAKKNLERILNVMSKFNLDQDHDVVNIEYNDPPGSYVLEISFNAFVNGIPCNVHVDIDEQTLGESK